MAAQPSVAHLRPVGGGVGASQVWICWFSGTFFVSVSATSAMPQPSEMPGRVRAPIGCGDGGGDPREERRATDAGHHPGEVAVEFLVVTGEVWAGQARNAGCREGIADVNPGADPGAGEAGGAGDRGEYGLS